MNSSKLSEWMQIIGIFAVVLSLIFVGLEMRQTQEIARATLYQMRSDSSTTIGGYMIENEQAREVAVRVAIGGTESLSPEDFLLNRVTCDSILGHFENSHHLYTLGFLADEQWNADRSQLAELLSNMCRTTWTKSVKDNLRVSFVEEVNDILEKGN
jgi:hypothetical protein